MAIKQAIKSTPILGAALGSLYLRAQRRRFRTSGDYWTGRYERGGDSGAGSYNKFARFKARVLNDFVRENEIRSVIEFGCGDGNQLRLADYPSYLGIDISASALDICRAAFAGDGTKQFQSLEEYGGETADLTLSLDVIYHLVEDATFESHLQALFGGAKKYVGIYSSNTDEQEALQPPHVRHREFTNWVAAHAPEYRLVEQVANPYPYNGNADETSFADFYFFAKGA